MVEALSVSTMWSIRRIGVHQVDRRSFLRLSSMIAACAVVAPSILAHEPAAHYIAVDQVSVLTQQDWNKCISEMFSYGTGHKTVVVAEEDVPFAKRFFKHIAVDVKPWRTNA